jgi:hypothetical protein
VVVQVDHTLAEEAELEDIENLQDHSLLIQRLL